MSHPYVYAGVDVAKASLMIFIPGGWGTRRFPNTPKGIGRFLKQASEIPGLAVCCEASGGYEQALLDACLEEQVPISVVAPNRVRHWAKGKGILAKTDGIDAPLISNYGEQNEVRFLEKPDHDWKTLRELTRERKYQVDRRKDLGNHLSMQRDPLLRRMNRLEYRATEKRIQKLEQRIQEVIQSRESLKVLVDRLMSVKGIGWVTASTVVAEFPYLGQLGPQAASALAGVAPFNCDSGEYKGKRRTRGGNARVRQALYMAAVSACTSNAILKDFYQRLLSRGKEKKVALIALARKLIRLMERIAADPSFRPLEGGAKTREEPTLSNESPSPKQSSVSDRGELAASKKTVQEVGNTPASGSPSSRASETEVFRTRG